MSNENILESALQILKDNNNSFNKNFKFAQSPEFINYVYEWLKKESDEDWIRDVLEEVEINVSSTEDEFIGSWEAFKSKINNTAILKILSTKITNAGDLFEYGRGQFEKDKSTISIINFEMTRLMIYFSLLFGVELNSSALDPNIIQEAKDDLNIQDSEEEGTSDIDSIDKKKSDRIDPDSSVSPLSSQPKEKKPSYKELQTSPFVAPQLKDKNFVFGKKYLEDSFKKFITETYIDKSQSVKSGDFNFPTVDIESLQSFFGSNVGKLFKGYYEGKELPVSFEAFWRNIPNLYKKNAEIKALLSTDLVKKPIDFDSESGIFNSVFEYIINEFSKVDNKDIKTFITDTEYDINQLSSWWSIGSKKFLANLKDSESKNQWQIFINYMNYLLDLPFSQRMLGTEEFNQSWNSIFHMIEFVNQKNKESGENLWIKEPEVMSPTETSTNTEPEATNSLKSRFQNLEIDDETTTASSYKSVKFAKLNSHKFYKIENSSNGKIEPKLSISENLRYSFNIKTAQPKSISLFQLGLVTDDIEVEAQKLKYLVEKLFTDIKLEEYIKTSRLQRFRGFFGR